MQHARMQPSPTSTRRPLAVACCSNLSSNSARHEQTSIKPPHFWTARWQQGQARAASIKPPTLDCPLATGPGTSSKYQATHLWTARSGGCARCGTTPRGRSCRARGGTRSICRPGRHHNRACTHAQAAGREPWVRFPGKQAGQHAGWPGSTGRRREAVQQSNRALAPPDCSSTQHRRAAAPAATLPC